MYLFNCKQLLWKSFANILILFFVTNTVFKNPLQSCTGWPISFGPLLKALRLEEWPKRYGAPCK